ncbi:MAG: methyltransferase domain-containing protein [Gammaproteobacteria bacterium]|nr:MAG: methyltransferase domain-containing protein [Gammaproteobacteria bacterium]
MNVNAAVLERYSEGAKVQQAELCCPVDYDTDLLKSLPQEIIDRDYGCGDPSRYVQPGDTVLDLGSGGGKICYMAAQVAGPQGHIIGIDMNDDMLALARSYQQELQEKFGGVRIDFVKGHIQDLKLDVDVLDAQLANHPIDSAAALEAFEQWKNTQKSNAPLIEDNSVDLVLSNCVLNLVDDRQKKQLLEEIYRVTRPGGRVAISDIVSDKAIPDEMKSDPELWSGCISGSFQEQEFLQAFADVGFVNVRYDKWETTPWRVINGIEFRSVTITAIKPELAKTNSQDQGNLMYRGPYQSVTTDNGIEFCRGLRTSVDSKAKQRLLSGSGDDFIDLDSTLSSIDKSSCCAPGSTCC